MILGSPAKLVKTLSAEESERLKASAGRYVRNAIRYRDHLASNG
jgi:carbonic anhydrase/acetyltransferase-like protein (isoleucine patch superfamily)